MDGVHVAVFLLPVKELSLLNVLLFTLLSVLVAAVFSNFKLKSFAAFLFNY